MRQTHQFHFLYYKNTNFIGLGAAISYLKDIGMDVIHEREMYLRNYLIEKLVKIPHVDIINLEADSIHSFHHLN